MSSEKRKLFFQFFMFTCLLGRIVSQVFELTEVSFDLYTRDKDVMLVEFIMPWCRHCQALQPEWEKATQILAENREYVMGKVNCWESGKSLCDKLKIAMYPEIRLYRHGVYTETYEGDRNAAAILDFVQRAQATTGQVGPPAPFAAQSIVVQPTLPKPTVPQQQYPQSFPTRQPFPPVYSETPGINYSPQPNQSPVQQQLPPPKPQPQQRLQPSLAQYFPPPFPPKLQQPIQQPPQPFKPLPPPYLPPPVPKLEVTSEQFYTTPLSGAYQAPPGALNLPIQTIAAKPDQEINFYETIIPPPPNSGTNFQVQELQNFQTPNLGSAVGQHLAQVPTANGQFIPGGEIQAFGPAAAPPPPVSPLSNMESIYAPQREIQSIPAEVYSQNGNAIWGINNLLPNLRNENNQHQYSFVNYNQPTLYQNYPSPPSRVQTLNQFRQPPRPITVKLQNPNSAHSAPSLWNFFQNMAFNQPGLPTNPQQMIRNQPSKNYKPIYDRQQNYPTVFAKNKVFSVEKAKLEDSAKITEEARQKFEKLKNLFSNMQLDENLKITSASQFLQNLKSPPRRVKVVDIPPYGNMINNKQYDDSMLLQSMPTSLNQLGYFKPRPIFEHPVLISPSNDKYLPGVTRSNNPQEEIEGPGLSMNYPRPSMYGLLHKRKPLERFIKRPLVNGIFTVQKELPSQLISQKSFWSPSIKNNPSGINQHRHALLHIDKGSKKQINTKPVKKTEKLVVVPISKERAFQIEQLRGRARATGINMKKNPIPLIVEEPRTDQALIRAKVENHLQSSMLKARLPFKKLQDKPLLPIYNGPLDKLQALLMRNPQLYKLSPLLPKMMKKENFSQLRSSFITTGPQEQISMINPLKVKMLTAPKKRMPVQQVLRAKFQPSQPFTQTKSNLPRKLPSSILRLNPLFNNALLRDRALAASRNKVDQPFSNSFQMMSKDLVTKHLNPAQNSAYNGLSGGKGHESASLMLSNLNSDVLKHSKMSDFFLPLKKNLMASSNKGIDSNRVVEEESYKKSPVKVEKGTTRYVIKPQPPSVEKDFVGIWDKLYEFYSKKKSYLKKADQITAQQKANTRSVNNNSIKRNEKFSNKVSSNVMGQFHQPFLNKNAEISHKSSMSAIKLTNKQIFPVNENEIRSNSDSKRPQKSENKSAIDDKDTFLKAITRDPRPWDKRAKVTFQISRKSSIPGKPKVVGVWGSLKKRKKRLTKRKRKKKREIRSIAIGTQFKTFKRSKSEIG